MLVAVAMAGLVAQFLALQAVWADTLQSRLDIGIGSVSSGFGSGPGAGSYEVAVFIRSHKRYAVYADDGGHEEDYCRFPDVPAASCGSDWIHVDGIKLEKETIENYSGLGASSKSLFIIEGSLNDKGGTKWEWPSEGWIDNLNLDSSVRETNRDIRVATTKFVVRDWNGEKVASKVRAKWFESDPSIFAADDHSEWAYFNTGDMITKCLQGGSSGSTRTILSKSANFYWHLCSEDGDCLQSFDNVGPGGLHYNIATYYYVQCYWTRLAECGNGLCEGGETCATCPGDCPPSYVCGDGICDSAWCEDAFVCPEDCQTL